MELPLFPLNSVLFPGATLPLHIFEPRYRQMINECIDQESAFGVVLIESGPEVGDGARPHRVGVTARITDVERMDDGRMTISTVGQDRFEIMGTSHERPYLLGDVRILADLDADTSEAQREAERVRALFLRFFQLTLAVRGEWARHVTMPRNPGHVADSIASRLPIANDLKQQLLQELSVPRRLADVAHLLDPACESAAQRTHTAFLRRYAGFGVLN